MNSVYVFTAIVLFYTKDTNCKIVEDHARSAVYQSESALEQHGGFGDQTHYGTTLSPRRIAEKQAKIISIQAETKAHQYQYQYETDNGIHTQETGQVQDGSQAHGSYSYTGDDGKVYEVTYTADKDGFRAHGSHLPTPPPIPEAILKALEQNAADEANGVYDEGDNQDQEDHHQGSHQNYHYPEPSAYQAQAPLQIVQAYQPETHHQDLSQNSAVEVIKSHTLAEGEIYHH